MADELTRRGPEGQQAQSHEEAVEPEDPRQRLLQRAMARRAVQRKAKGQPGPARIPEGGGAPLERGVQQTMEQHLGADLSAVRIHTGGPSEGAASDLSARAFTVGNDVHFNAGEFAPESREGKKLLTHELTHVVQGQKAGVQRKAEEGAAPKEASAGEAAAPEEEGAEGGEALGTPEEALAAAIAAGEEAGEGDETQEVSSPEDAAEKEADQKAEELDGGGEAGPVSAKPEGVSRQIFRQLNPDALKEKKKGLQDLLSQIQKPEDLALKEAELQTWANLDPVLAKMIAAYRQELTGHSQPLTGVTPGKPKSSKLDLFKGLGDSPLNGPPDDPKALPEYELKKAKREAPTREEAMAEDHDRGPEQQRKLPGAGNEGTMPNDPHRDTSVAVDVLAIGAEVGKHLGGGPESAAGSATETHFTKALTEEVEKLLTREKKVTMQEKAELRHKLDGRIKMLNGARAKAKKDEGERAIYDPQLEELHAARERLNQ